MKKVLSFQSVARQLSRRTPQCFNNNNNNNKVFKQTFVTHSSMSSAQFIGQSSPGHNWFLEEPYTMSIIGAPINTGQPKTGVEKGPSSIREIGLIEKVREVGWRVIDEGDIDIPQIDETADPTTEYGLKRSRATAAANKSLHERVYMAAKQGNFVTTIGGDHSLGIGSVSGILRARPKTRVIWVDAHADINTDTTSPSGNIHGMSVALLMQLHNLDHFPGWEWMRDLDPLPESNIVYIGLRDIDPGEKTILWKLGIRSFSMYEVDRYGIGPVIDMAIKSVDPKGKHPLHVSFDIDSLDPTVAPSTGTPVVGGLTFREGAFLLESLASTNRLCSMDLVEVNPDAGETEKEQTQTVEMGRRMISCASGELLLWGDQPHYRQ